MLCIIHPHYGNSSAMGRRFLPLQFLPLQFLPLHFLSLLFLTLQFLPLQFLPLQFLPLQFLPLQFPSLQFLTLQFLPLQFLPLQFLPLQFFPLHFYPPQKGQIYNTAGRSLQQVSWTPHSGPQVSNLLARFFEKLSQQTNSTQEINETFWNKWTEFETNGQKLWPNTQVSISWPVRQSSIFFAKSRLVFSLDFFFSARV